MVRVPGTLGGSALLGFLLAVPSWKVFMTFAYYAGPEAVKGLQKFHDKGGKVTENTLKKLDGIMLPEFYKKAAEVMQEEKTTLKPLPNFH